MSTHPLTNADPAMQALGRSLYERRDVVVERIVEASAVAGLELEDTVEKRFRKIGSLSTVAVARWMSGERLEDAREVGLEVWQIIGQLAAQRAAPLTEITKLCLRWRGAAGDVLTECAASLGIAPESVRLAGEMLQQTLDLTLVHVCDSFEAERRQADEELAFLATHDPLTGLPNRTLILDRAQQMLARARRQHMPVGAIFIDLDNFKLVNDTLGHGAGDELLCAVSARLAAVLRETDALGRLGGDEFVVLAEGVSLAAGPELVAERLIEALRAPFTLEQGGRVEVFASVGIATSAPATSAEDLLKNADIAMYRAKWDGKNRAVLFETEMQGALETRVSLEMDLREALGNREFHVVYQPIFDLVSMRPTDVEALLRWEHPSRGLVQPEDFVPLLEETGLINDIGSWVLTQASSQAAIWRSEGHDIGVAVNVSARQLDSDQLIEDVKTALRHSGLTPSALTLEITETTLMRDAQETPDRLAAIKELGVRIAIDDFGTGYSSLAHVQKFPVDSLKIDRSFVAGFSHSPEGEAIIQTLVQLGKALSIETVAEGIEQRAELEHLKGHSCDSGQGFLFARPLKAEATLAFLQEWADQPSLPVRPAPHAN